MGEVRTEIGEDALIVDTRRLPDRSVEVDVAIGSSPSAHEMLSLSHDHETKTFGVRERPQSRHAEHPAIDLLREGGFGPDILERLELGMGGAESFVDGMAEAFGSTFAFDSSLVPHRQGSPKIVALVGPTGVGKTTTLAKLAAQLRLAFDLKIGFISADSFRVGAAHQLQTYANLLRIPCRTVCPPGTSRTGGGMLERIDDAIAEFQGMDLILVDTAGVSARDKERLQLLQESLGNNEYVERLLVLQAPSNEKDLMLAAEAFSPLQCSRLIITKLDETNFSGPVLNVGFRLRLPLAYFCHGQRVPEDIEPASAKRLAHLVTSRYH